MKLRRIYNQPEPPCKIYSWQIELAIILGGGIGFLIYGAILLAIGGYGGETL